MALFSEDIPQFDNTNSPYGDSCQHGGGSLDFSQLNNIGNSDFAHQNLQDAQQHFAHSSFDAVHHTFSSSSDDSAHPYTTIDNDGYIYKHASANDTGDVVATIRGGEVHQFGGYESYLGRAGTDGNVYDKNDHIIGWVDNQGQVFDSAGHHVSDTTKGSAGAAAYLLTVYAGGVP